MAVRTVTAAAVLTAAVAVYALVRKRERRLRREAAAQRLMAGCTSRDNAALLRQVDYFRRRLGQELAHAAVLASAGLVVDDALSQSPSRIDPSSEGGPQ